MSIPVLFLLCFWYNSSLIYITWYQIWAYKILSKLMQLIMNCLQLTFYSVWPPNIGDLLTLWPLRNNRITKVPHSARMKFPENFYPCGRIPTFSLMYSFHCTSASLYPLYSINWTYSHLWLSLRRVSTFTFMVTLSLQADLKILQ